jgi:hypothetical protein
MLDSFLGVAYTHEAKAQLEKEAVALLKQLPADDLLKLASGEKLAWMGADPCGPGGSTSFLDKFKGTPLFEEALALEQEELQAQMTDLERRKEQRVTQQGEQGLWDMQDQLRIKKRLLELRQAQEEGGMAAGGGGPPPMGAPPGMDAPGANAVGPEAAPAMAMKTAGKARTASSGVKSWIKAHPRSAAAAGVGAFGAAQGALVGHVLQDKEKLKSDAKKHPNSKLHQFAAHHPAAFGALLGGAIGTVGGAAGADLKLAAFDPSLTIDGWGRELARTDFTKAANAAAISKAASEAGAVLAKEAIDFGALGSMASKFVKNPKNLNTLVGAGVGAAGGLASGLQKDQNGQRHLLGGVAQGVAGGALGGLAGHATQNIGKAMSGKKGVGFVDAAKQYGSGWGNRIKNVASSMQPATQVA